MATKKVKVSVEQYVSKWTAGLQGAQQSYTDGVNNVTENPCVQAANQRALWLSKTAASADKWEANLRKVSLETWRTSAVQKGAPALANSAVTAEPKVRAAAAVLIPAINDALASIPKRGATLAANIARVTHMATKLQTAFSQK